MHGTPAWRAAALALAALCGGAQAQDYPVKAVRFVVGSGPDVMARLVGQKLGELWGQQFLIDQRPGAGGILAAETVVKAAPDGYTLLLTSGGYTINASLYAKLSYDLERDLAPVTLLSLLPLIMAVHPSVPAKSVADLVQLARRRPGQLNCASSGNGSTPHLACELLKNAAKLDIVHVPYKGLAPAVTDTLSGQMQLLFINPQFGLQHARGGRLRALAVTSPARAASAPELPTVAEAGLAELTFESWNGVHVPVQTPKAIVAKLNAGLLEVMKHPEVRERVAGMGLNPVGSTPGEFAALIRADIARWAKVVKESKIRPECCA